MKKKLYLFIIIFIIIIGCILFLIKISEIEEYIPEAEISEADLKATDIILYVYNIETNDYEKFNKKLDNQKLSLSPYEEIIKLFLEENINSKKFSEILKINNLNLEKFCLKIDFESLNQISETDKKIIYESLNKTLTQFNEVAEIKVFFDNEEN